MKINPLTFGLASAMTAAIVWIICSIFVSTMPGMMMNMSGDMVHANLSGMNWTLTAKGILVGLVSWSILAGISAWLLAFIYNLLVKEV